MLEEALSFLKGMVLKLPVDKRRSKRLRATRKKEVEDGCENLILEDTDGSSDDHDQVPSASPRKQLSSDIIYEQDETEKEEEFRFASYCLIKDLHDLQQYLLGLWQRHQRKEVDLVVAAATTNMAINLARRSREGIRNDRNMAEGIRRRMARFSNCRMCSSHRR